MEEMVISSTQRQIMVGESCTKLIALQIKASTNNVIDDYSNNFLLNPLAPNDTFRCHKTQCR